MESLSKSLNFESDPEAKAADAQQLLNWSKQYQDLYYQGMGFFHLGKAYSDLGALNMALEQLQFALQHFESVGHSRGVESVYNEMGSVHLRRGDYDAARFYFSRVINLASAKQDSVAMAGAFINMGDVHRQGQQYDSALYYSEQADQWIQSGPIAPIYQAINDGNRALVWQAKGQNERAELALEEVTSTLEEYEMWPAISIYLRALAEIAMHRDELERAYQFAEKSYRIAENQSLLAEMAESARLQADVSRRQGELPYALQLMDRALVLEDSLRHRADRVADLRREMEVGEKQAEINALGAANRLQQYLSWTLGGGLALTLVLMGLLYRSRQQKNRSNLLLAQRNAEVVKQRELLAEQNRDITDSIHYARQIQQALFPLGEGLNAHLPGHFLIYKPLQIVSGDFYWTYRTEELLIVVLADCTGHGVPGALMSILGISLLEEVIDRKGITQPHEALEMMDAELRRLLKKQDTDNLDGMDMAMLCWEAKSRTLEFAGANLPLLWQTKGQPDIQSIRGDRAMIGGRGAGEREPFSKHTLVLTQEVRVFLSSDGFQDQFGGPRGKKIMRKRFYEWLAEHPQQPLKHTEDHLNQKLEEWRWGQPQVDDITVLGFEL